MIHGKAPVSFKEWHVLYHYTRDHCLLPASMTYWRWRIGMPFMAEQRADSLKRLVKIVRQIMRIEQHMSEAQERNDPTWLDHRAWVMENLPEGGQP